MKYNSTNLTEKEINFLESYYLSLRNELFATYGDNFTSEMIEEHLNLVFQDPDKDTKKAIKILGRASRDIIYDEISSKKRDYLLPN